MLLVLTLGVTSPAKEWDPVEYDGVICKELTDFMIEVEKEYKGISAHRIMTKEDYAQEAATMQKFKTKLSALVKRDLGIRRMGVCPVCFEKQLWEEIKTMHFGGDTNNLGSWDNDGHELYLKVSNPKDMAYTASHELIHTPLFGGGEDVAELFAQVITHRTGEPQKEVTIVRRGDLVYSTAQIRGIYNYAKKDGKEKEFWQSISTREGVKEMWDRYSPRYEKDGKDEQYMTFDEWQSIKSISGLTALDKMCISAVYKNQYGTLLHEDLEKLSIAFGKLYNKKKFDPKVLEDIKKFTAFAKEQQVPPIYVAIDGAKSVIHDTCECTFAEK
jgi:hypothetical protein